VAGCTVPVMSWSKRPGQDGDQPAGGGILERPFDAATLGVLRQEIHAYAVAAGASAARSADLMLAVHELAANAVRHGAGRGRLRLRDGAGRLHCQVDDDGPADLASRAGAGHPDGDGAVHLGPWPARPGHGLWVVRTLADQVTVRSGPDGSHVTAVFPLHAAGKVPAPGPAR
jgi:anti-sigma regulatory factor (Ser/Thr protein kinase)